VLPPIIIDDVRPRTPSGAPAKAAVGERMPVGADVFRDGHDLLAARVRWRPIGESKWEYARLTLANLGLDRWAGTVVADRMGRYEFQIEAWTDQFATWRHHAELKAAAHDPELELVLEEGALLLDRLTPKAPKEARPALAVAANGLRDTNRTLDERLTSGLDDHVAALLADVADPLDFTRTKSSMLWVDRERGRESAWYELFPRSEGGFAGATKRLAAIASMGFDIVYFPPIHPIGRTFRKGPNNTVGAGPDDLGSPWAIGGKEGGHTAIHPELGSINDFEAFVDEAETLGMEVALDYALQCSPDHPWVREHPEWFHHRPDGSIAYAENPPKKYQDIYPLNFWPEKERDRVALWEACLEIFDYWIAHGVHVFRVDNPHTKPFAFWDWVIAAVRVEHPEIIFLAEAFTRPRVMAKLAEVGFTQSYTYFAWRTVRWELEEYVTELAHGPTADYMRPNFWPNTPDILSGVLRNGPPSAFRLRLLLAATMSPSYGIYSGYELCENEPISEANEEYLNSEKYELKTREWDRPDSLAPFITEINDIRRRHRAFTELRTIQFHESDNDRIIVYSKTDAPANDGTVADVVLCVVNLDPSRWHEATLSLDVEALGVTRDTFEVYDELSAESYVWNEHPYVRLDPAQQAGHVFEIRTR
jgi:starch synthase (maltosyl-transferring)